MFSWVRVAALAVLAVHVLADNDCDNADDPTSMLQNFQTGRTSPGKQAAAKPVGFAAAHHAAHKTHENRAKKVVRHPAGAKAPIAPNAGKKIEFAKRGKEVVRHPAGAKAPVAPNAGKKTEFAKRGKEVVRHPAGANAPVAPNAGKKTEFAKRGKEVERPPSGANAAHAGGAANETDLAKSSKEVEPPPAGANAPLADGAANETDVPGYRRPAGAKDTDCLLDSSSMWGTHLQNLHFDKLLKGAFNQIIGGINHKVKPGCKHVTISASLFAMSELSGRKHKDLETEAPALYEGPAGCAVFVLSTWQAKILRNVSKSDTPGGWNLVPFPTDDFLEKIDRVHRSNELQRLFNLVKIGAPLFVSKDVKRVTFADVKCNLPSFSRRVEHINNPKTDIYTFQHPGFWKKALMKEWKETKAHLETRHEMSPVFEDMWRVRKYFGDSFLRQRFELAEIMCMSFERTERNEAVQSFLRRWFFYTSHYTMRPQLTWNAALVDCGKGVKVDYMPYMDARIKVHLVQSGEIQNFTGA